VRLGILVGVKDINIERVGGTAQTPRDWSVDFAYLTRIPTDPSRETNQSVKVAKSVTWIRKRAAIVGGGSAIVYTVTAGKTFYLVAANAGINGSAWMYLYLRDETDVLVGNILIRYGAGGQVIAFPIPLAIPAGWDIVLEIGGTLNGEAMIFGWEE